MRSSVLWKIFNFIHRPAFIGNRQIDDQSLQFFINFSVTKERGNMSPKAITCDQVKNIWRNADGVCFDVDSTVCQDEGIDELAKYCGVGEQVKAWTVKAMSHGISFREALDARLRIINPTRQQLADFIDKHPPRLSPGIQELIALLQTKRRKVFLVSGGFRDIISRTAQEVNIPQENIFANDISFDLDGQYSGFDETAPTSDSGGKSVALSIIKEQYGLKSLVMVGDGVTDMEACPPADVFIGYGGNVTREKVRSNAKWFVTDFQDLIKELQSS